MSNSATEITNLLYRYAELMDAGDMASVAALFAHAKTKVASEPELVDEAGMLRIWRTYNKIYPCGTPRTKHLITNPIIEIDEENDKARCRSYYTVLQATDELPLQAIAAGRYIDEFERVNGTWRFSFRDYSLLEMAGDLSHHLNIVPNLKQVNA